MINHSNMLEYVLILKNQSQNQQLYVDYNILNRKDYCISLEVAFGSEITSLWEHKV
jgi:hypothetical protein